MEQTDFDLVLCAWTHKLTSFEEELKRRDISFVDTDLPDTEYCMDDVCYSFQSKQDYMTAYQISLNEEF